MFVITQVDKDASGVAFVCKNIAHKLAKRFIYGPNPKTFGLFELNQLPIFAVVSLLRMYSLKRGIRP